MDYRNTYSWKMTLELMPELVQLADELPSSEDQGLRRHLLDLEVELPTAVGLDLGQGGERRREQLMKLQAVVDLVEAIYPAIDASKLATNAQELESRLLGSNFAEELPKPESPEEEPDGQEADAQTSAADLEPEPEPSQAVKIRPVSEDSSADV